jgi:hypothetical protein
MASIVIPDKVCKKCGGINWREQTCKSRVGLICGKCADQRKLKWIKENKEKHNILNNASALKRKELIKDAYVRHLMYNQAYNKDGTRLNTKLIPQEVIEKQREILKIQRFIKEQTSKKQVNNMETVKKRERVTTPDMTPAERQAVYNKNWLERKKAKQESLSATTTTLAELIDSSVEVVSAPKVSAPEEDIVSEFNKLEARRKEIIIQVEQLNNYLESLKIKLS